MLVEEQQYTRIGGMHYRFIHMDTGFTVCTFIQCIKRYKHSWIQQLFTAITTIATDILLLPWVF